MTKSGQTTFEPVKSEIVTIYAIAVQDAFEIAERKKAKQVKHAMAIVDAGDYSVAKFG